MTLPNLLVMELSSNEPFFELMVGEHHSGLDVCYDQLVFVIMVAMDITLNRFRFHFIHHSALSYDLPDPSSYLSKIYKALLRSYASCARQHNTTQHNTAQSINCQWCTRSMHTSTTMKKDKKLNLLLLLVIFYDDEGKSIFSIRNNTNSVTISSPSSSSSSSSPHPTMNVEWIVGQEWACAQ